MPVELCWLIRKWLREANPQSARDIEKAYVQVLGKSTLADSLPLRTLRFAITTIAGLNPIIGLVAGAIDNFFFDKWLSGYITKKRKRPMSFLMTGVALIFAESVFVDSHGRARGTLLAD